ncbi:hypothetical protein [Halobacillus seohaensis]
MKKRDGTSTNLRNSHVAIDITALLSSVFIMEEGPPFDSVREN